MALKQSLVERSVQETVGMVIKKSLTESNGCWWMLAETEQAGIRLVHVFERESSAAALLQQERFLETDGMKLIVAPLNANNAAVLRRFLKWTAPGACGTKGMSIGVSDYLGAAAAFAAAPFVGKNMKPVLVDFSAADSLTSQRTFIEAVDTATWGIFSSGFREGYGANAAGLKTEEDIVKALLYGYSMIGLDCSDKIDVSIEALTGDAVDKKFFALNEAFCAAVHASYLNTEFAVGEDAIIFGEEQLHRIILEYGEAIMHIQFLYNSYLKNTPWEIDFELTLNKPGKMMTPQEHYLLANELQRNHIKLSTLCFDVLDVAEQKDLQLHCRIAEIFGHRLSFANAEFLSAPAEIGKALKGRVHFKLNNLLWFSGLQCIAELDRTLYAKITSAAGVAGQDEPKSNAELKALATGCRQVLTAEEGKLKEAMQSLFEVHAGEYADAIEKNLREFFSRL